MRWQESLAGAAVLTAFVGAFGLSVSLAGCGGGISDADYRRSETERDLAAVLLGERNIAGAFQHLRESIRLDPDNAQAHFDLGSLHVLRGESREAEAELREAIAANARLGSASLPALTADANNSLGVLFLNDGRFEEAAGVLESAARDVLYRTPHLAWLNLGWAYTELHRYPDAIDALEQSIRLQPNNCGAWYRLGVVSYRRGELAASGGEGGDPEGFAHAEEALTHALEIERDECRALQDAWLLRGQTRVQLGRRDEAVEDFERCVELAANTEAGRACAGFLAGEP